MTNAGKGRNLNPGLRRLRHGPGDQRRVIRLPEGEMVKIPGGRQELLYLCGATSQLAIDKGQILDLNIGNFRMLGKIPLHPQPVTA